MSINGYLLNVSPALAERVRADPELAARITMQASLASWGGAMDGDVAGMLDATLGGALPAPLGCAYGLVPRFVRRWLIGRVVGRSTPVPDAPDDPMPPADPPSAGDLRRLALEAGFDAEDLDDLEDLVDPDPTPAPDEPGVGRTLCVHKDWQALHWLITGDPEELVGPAGGAVLGGEELGEDLGYGPVRLLTPAEVATIHAALSEAGPAGLMRRYDGRAMDRAEVYGGDWTDRWEAESVEQHLDALCAFYAEAAETGDAVLLWLG